MVEHLYCQRSDVTERVPPGAITSPGGLSASVSASSNAVTLDGHGFETDQPVKVRAIEGGALPSPLVAGTTYYVRRLDHARFELAAAPAGAAIDITANAGEIIVSRDPSFDYWIEFYSRWADGFFPAHAVPFGVTEPVHPVVRGCVADCVAKRTFNLVGYESATLAQVELAAKAQLERHASGLPLRGAPAPSPTNLAVTSTLSGRASDPRGWGSGSIP